jgi:beta-ribofuranosylaminobenzene 5'-phosphate synthase
MVFIRAYPRIHMGLLDLGNVTFRSYGGIGFTISGIPCEVIVKNSTTNTINGINHLDSSAQNDIYTVINRFKNQFSGKKFEIELVSLPPQHIGLGSKTLLLLSLIKGMSLETKIDLNKEDIQRMSGRGGASGIGIHSFFKGGFIVDGGHLRDEKQIFLPSNARKNFTIPPIIVHSKFPSDWVICVILPDGNNTSGKSELEFFNHYTPIPKIDVLNSIAVAYHGIVTSILTSDIICLRKSLILFHEIGFKKIELSNQTDSVRTLYSNLSELENCAVGLSSMGPLLYLITNKDKLSISDIESIVKSSNARILGNFTGRNKGYRILK